MNKKILISIIGLSTLAFSCNTSSESDTSVYHDAYIHTKMVSGQEKHSLGINVISFSNIESSSVITPSGNKTILEYLDNNKSYYTNTNRIYSDNIPNIGKYSFTTIIKGEEPKTDEDYLASTSISPANIISSEIKLINQNKFLEIIWKQNKEVSRYKIELYNRKGDLVFASEYLRRTYEGSDMNENQTQLIANPLSGAGLEGWINKDIYITDIGEVKIIAIRFEDDATTDLSVNFQAMSESTISLPISE